MTKFEILVYLAEHCHEFICISDAYQDWVSIGLTCANYGELGRVPFHQFSQQSTKYNQAECDKVYNGFLKRSKHVDSIGGIVKLLPFNLDNWLQERLSTKQNNFSFTAPQPQKVEQKKETFQPQQPAEPKKQTFAEWSVFLPAMVRDLANQGETEEQKIACFFSALCCFSACMGDSSITYGGQLTYLQLYYCLCGSAGSGKGCINKVKKYFFDLHNYLRKVNEQERKEWSKNKERDMLNVPPNYMLFFPSNSSSSALMDALIDNKGAGIMFESELDTMLSVFKNDYGNYSSVLRANFHNEHISTYRKANRELKEITNSHFSVCLSGTPDQYATLLKGEGENGLISRFVFTYIEDKSEFINPFQSSISQPKNDLPTYIIDIYRTLQQQPIYLNISEFDASFFVDTMRQIESQIESDNDISITRRLSLTWVRMAGILTILRHIENCNLTQVQTIDSDILHNLAKFVPYLLDNALKLRAIASTDSNKGTKINTIFAQLSAKFSRQDVEILAKCTDRTARRYISAWKANGLISKPKQGIYTKVDI